MSNGDMAAGMALRQAQRVQNAVNRIEWEKCPVGHGDDHRQVTQFLVDGMTELLARRDRSLAFLSGSGVGAGLLVGIDIVGRAKGWW